MVDLLPNPPIEHLIVFGPRNVTRDLILGLYPVMKERNKLPAFHMPQSLDEIMNLLPCYGRAGILLADSEEENQKHRDWLRERWPGAKIMTLTRDATVRPPFSYQDVRWPMTHTSEDYGYMASWFGICTYSNGISSYTVDDPDAVSVQALRDEQAEEGEMQADQ